MNARPITWPTVPKGKDRVRVCLHAGNSWSEIDRLIEAILGWAVDIVAKSKKRGETEGEEGSREGCSGIDGVKIVTAFHPSRRDYSVMVNISGTRL